MYCSLLGNTSCSLLPVSVVRRHNGLYGFIAVMLSLASGTVAQSEEVVSKVDNPAPRFNHPFSNGEFWGYLDNHGTEIVEPQYSWADDYYSSRALVARDNIIGYLAPDGHLAFTLPSGADYGRRCVNGLIWYRFNGVYGLVDQDGKRLLEPQYSNVGDFSEGCAPVRLPKANSRTDESLWIYIDSRGRQVITERFEFATPFSQGLAVVKRAASSTCEYIDRTGRVVFSPARLCRSDDEWVRVCFGFENGRALVHIDGRLEEHPFSLFVDKRGAHCWNRRFKAAASFSEGLAAIVQDEKVGFVDEAGTVVIRPTFEESGRFREGVCSVRIGDYWSYINSSGSLIGNLQGIRTDWNDCEEFHHGLARVHIGGRFRVTLDGPSRWEGGTWYYVNNIGEILAKVCSDGESERAYGREILVSPR